MGLNNNMREPATNEEINICLEEARRENPEATDEEIEEIAKQIFEEREGEGITYGEHLDSLD